MAMADLRKAFADLGFEDVATHIQTGNVVFTANGDPTRRVEDGLAEALDYRGTVFVLTPAQLVDAARNNPFEPKDDQAHSQLMFLSEAPSPARVNALMEMEGEEYRFQVRGKVLYYAYPRSAGGRGRKSIDFEKVLGVKGTSRSWKVVRRLIEMAPAGKVAETGEAAQKKGSSKAKGMARTTKAATER